MPHPCVGVLRLTYQMAISTTTPYLLLFNKTLFPWCPLFHSNLIFCVFLRFCFGFFLKKKFIPLLQDQSQSSRSCWSRIVPGRIQLQTDSANWHPHHGTPRGDKWDERLALERPVHRRVLEDGTEGRSGEKGGLASLTSAWVLSHSVTGSLGG